MIDPLVSIIMRSFNEGWALQETLPALKAQEYRNWELIVIDSGSTDGSVELIRQARPRHLVQIRSEEYNPSRVMNQGMRLAAADIAVFLNADATPQGSCWLRPLVNALRDPQTAAVYGRQIPRPGCRAVYAHDYERCFGPNREAVRWAHFFSMVSSGIRKDIWSRRGFLESMQYSEDDEYTRWCRAQGYRVLYCPGSVVMHSHNYTPAQAYQRTFGEARALAAVWNGRPTAFNWPRTVLLGWLNDLRRDVLFCARRRQWRELPHAGGIRWQQRKARLAGFRAGWQHYRAAAPGCLRAAGSRASTVHRVAPPAADGKAAIPQTGNRGYETPGQPSKINPRFTLDGSSDLEKRLARTCDDIRNGLTRIIPPSKIDAIVLGGGYGRGEGGVLRTAAGDRSYNDLEFYIFMRGCRFWNDRRYRTPLESFAARISPAAGLHVEFKIDSLSRLQGSSITMFSYDLVAQHRVIAGLEDPFIGCEHHLVSSAIPLAEATRLLLNRGSGLLLASEMLEGDSLTEEEADFVARNLAKAQLALGDALLTTFGQYHWSCLERGCRLQNLLRDPHTPDLDLIRQHHSEGVRFKLHPSIRLRTPAAFRGDLDEISGLMRDLWLRLESRRLNRPFRSPREYSLSELPKCPEQDPWRNCLLNVATFGPRAVLNGRFGRYPRERLLEALPLLLWSPDRCLTPDLHERLQATLQTDAADWAGLVSTYKKIWPTYG